MLGMTRPHAQLETEVESKLLGNIIEFMVEYATYKRIRLVDGIRKKAVACPETMH